MLKKILLICSLFFLITPIFSSQATEIVEVKENEIYLFSSPTCPHCADAKKFLNDFQKNKLTDLSIIEYSISSHIEEIKDFYQRYDVPRHQQGLVPAIFLEEKYFVGFNDQIKTDIIEILEKSSSKELKDSRLIDEKNEKKELVKLPFLGEVNLFDFSLPLLAIILGIVDGFNVCSLGALMVILGLVLALRSRKKIILFGGTFILVTTLVYGILIFLWHQFFAIISPYIRNMEVLIGILAIVGGIYLFREFYKAYKSGPICSSNNLMSRLTPKIQKIFQSKRNVLVLLSTVAIFATIVTVIEFPCSAFLPVLFTSILVQSGIPLGISIFYISLYLLFYLLDEIILFAIASLTLKIKIVSPKFIVFFNLVAALIFLFLGFYYIFGWLS